MCAKKSPSPAVPEFGVFFFRDRKAVSLALNEIRRDRRILRSRFFIGSVGSMPLQLLEIGFHVEIHAIKWHDFQHETQFHGVVVACIEFSLFYMSQFSANNLCCMSRISSF